MADCFATGQTTQRESKRARGEAQGGEDQDKGVQGQG
eukprot:CAMPEP_0204510758 /NCGR_PEP_ID=MMETSP0661-20131031/68_1 /ASSEMBLY_ACC=CAM_ASM_000606 /TAXON_ID=109239 /ORGANISM="Alexandrium margalefi, Strain AMGDE01CS-322" /LENGTH=36 /DNA_ID= /DNA_START= /DNA_END= /DNA_ORIENTATION=